MNLTHSPLMEVEKIRGVNVTFWGIFSTSINGDGGFFQESRLIEKNKNMTFWGAARKNVERLGFQNFMTTRTFNIEKANFCDGFFHIKCCQWV